MESARLREVRPVLDLTRPLTYRVSIFTRNEGLRPVWSVRADGVEIPVVIESDKVLRSLGLARAEAERLARVIGERMVHAKPVIELIDGTYLPAPGTPTGKVWKAMLAWEQSPGVWEDYGA